MTQPKPIKASLGFKKLSPGDVLTRANAVLEGVYRAKQDYPNPPVDEAMLKTQVDALSAGLKSGFQPIATVPTPASPCCHLAC